MADAKRGRRFKALQLNEISAVDRPAQEHATFAIAKREVSDDARQRLADEGKAMPDGSFPIATKADLKNAVRAIGRAADPAAVKRHIIRRARALDALDALPDDWSVKKVQALADAVVKAAVKGTAPQTFEEAYRRNRMNQVTGELWPYYSALQDSVSSIIGDTDLSDDERRSALEATTASFVDTVLTKVPDVDTELAKGGADTAEGDTAMADQELTKKNEELAKELETVKSQLAAATALGALTDAEKAFHAALPEADRAGFLAQPAEKRAEVVKKAAEADEVIKTADGLEVRKSAVGEAVFAMIKRQEALNVETSKRLAEETEKRVDTEIAKRIGDDFSHLPNVDNGLNAVLKAARTMPETAQKALDAVLKAADAALTGAFDTVGHNNGKPTVAKGDAGAFNDKIAEVMKRDSVDKTTAMTRARKEFPDAFAKAYPETAEAAAA